MISSFRLSVLILILYIFAFSSQSFGATYYIRSDGNNSNSGLSWTLAKKSFGGTGGAYSVAVDGSTVVFAAGTYSTSNDYNQNYGLHSITIRAANATLDSGITGWQTSYAGTPIIDTGGNNGIYFNTSGITLSISGFEIRNATTNGNYGIKILQGTITVNDTVIRNCSRGVQVDNTPTVVMNRVKFLGCLTYSGSYSVYKNGASNITLNYPYFGESSTRLAGRIESNAASGTFQINNGVFSSMADNAVENTGTGTVGFTNCLFLGWDAFQTTADQFNNTSTGSISVSNCATIGLPIGSLGGFTKDPWDDYDTPTASFEADPKISGVTGSGGAVGICVDDGNRLYWAEEMAALAAQYGWPIEYSCSVQKLIETYPTDYAARLQALVNLPTQPDVAAHQYSFWMFTDIYAIQAYGPNASSKIIVIDSDSNGFADRLDLDTDGDGTGDIQIPISTTTTLQNLIDAINAYSGSGWVAREYQGGYYGLGTAEALADGIKAGTYSTPIGSWNNINWYMSQTNYTKGHYGNEIYAPKQWLTNAIQSGASGRAATYTVDTFVYSGGKYNSGYASDISSLEAVRNSGYLGARGAYDTSSTRTIYFQPYSTSVEGNLYRINCYNGQWAALTEAQIRYRANVIALRAMQGEIGFITCHYSGDMSVEQVGWIFQEWAKWPGLNVTTPRQLIHNVRNNGLYEKYADDTVNGGELWHLKSGSTLTSFNFTGLQSNSPCINTGEYISSIHLQTTPFQDLNGTYVLNLPDIGAYEYIDQNLYFKESAENGNGTKEYPYGSFGEYPYWTGYGIRSGITIYLEGELGTLDLSGLTQGTGIIVETKKSKKSKVYVNGVAIISNNKSRILPLQ